MTARKIRIVPRAWDRREPVADCPQPESAWKPLVVPPLQHARSMEAIRPPSNNERRAAWAERYYRNGHHNTPAAADAAAGTPSPANPLDPRAPGCRQGALSTPAAVRSARVPSRSRGAAAGFSTIAEWDAYYAGTGPRPTLPPF